MNVLLVGHGGREAALAWRIARSPSLTSLTVTGSNPGWPASAVLRPASAVQDLVALAQELAVDLVVVGPEAPLEAGLADALEVAGIPCFGPQRAAARLETSKAFAKAIMDEAGVPTPGHLRVDRNDPDSVQAAQERVAKGDVVVKVDGLAAGKGVIVCRTGGEGTAALAEVWSGRFGAAADTLVLEDRISGPEVSVFCITDGTNAVGLTSSQDHKTLLEGNEGPNTGGMGAYAPCPLLDEAGVDEIVRTVHLPVLQALAARGTPYRGVLYAGIMLTADGPRVLEFNARFGDPECQPLMMLWDEDVLPWLLGAAKGVLPEGRPHFADGSACCVVLASRGYPATSEKGTEIPEPESTHGVQVFHAGTQRDMDGVLRTNGGRVLGITGVGPDIRTARDRAYIALEGWRFDGCQLRRDIAYQALR